MKATQRTLVPPIKTAHYACSGLYPCGTWPAQPCGYAGATIWRDRADPYDRVNVAPTLIGVIIYRKQLPRYLLLPAGKLSGYSPKCEHTHFCIPVLRRTIVVLTMKRTHFVVRIVVLDSSCHWLRFMYHSRRNLSMYGSRDPFRCC
jgi:hypothetical protein